jgi:hypothetical protein
MGAAGVRVDGAQQVASRGAAGFGESDGTRQRAAVTVEQGSSEIQGGVSQTARGQKPDDRGQQAKVMQAEPYESLSRPRTSAILIDCRT